MKVQFMGKEVMIDGEKHTIIREEIMRADFSSSAVQMGDLLDHRILVATRYCCDSYGARATETRVLVRRFKDRAWCTGGYYEWED